MKRALFLFIPCFASTSVLPLAADIVISELMASNGTVLADEDSEFSDWIEVANTGAAAVELEGWHLTDETPFNILDPESVWTFPARVIAPGERLVVFASGKNRRPVAQGELHTHFKLSSTGEYLALVEPDGMTIASDFAPSYPGQEINISYGLTPAGYNYFTEPTPGAANGAGFFDTVKDTKFSFDRGFYEEPFDLVVSSATPGATIIYTTDGSAPSGENGTSALSPVTIPITTTTPLRAVAVKDGYLPSNIDTQSYIFIADVIHQGNTPTGYPETWKGNGGVGTETADYEMDPEVTDSAQYRELIDDALLAVPTISLVTEKENLFDPASGIYQNPQQKGTAWERPVSFEVIHPDGTTEGIQVDAGIRIQGGHTRLPSKNPKHSFRLSFKSEYGPSKLNYALFPDDPDAATEFDQLILRGSGNQSWLHHNTFKGDNRGRAQYIRDQWAKDVQLAMGHPAARSMYAHVYINGIYWGMYNPSERGTAGFGESYLGGDKEDYQTLNSGEAVDGTDARVDYNQLIALANGGLTDSVKYAQMAELLDLEAFTDYMLIQQYGGNLDWDHHNWYALRNKNGGKWYYLCWDSEFVFISATDNVLSLNNSEDPSRIWRKLLENDEYRILFADRAQKYFFNNGLLTPDAVMTMWDQRKDQMFEAIVAESARWGDYRRDIDPVGTPSPIPLYDRDEEWATERERLFSEYFPVRTDMIVEQYRTAGYLPNFDAPDFNQHGGQIPLGFIVKPQSRAGDIYYTTDGSDPRLEGGMANPMANILSGGAVVNRLVSLESADWHYLDTGSDLGGSDIVDGHPSYGPDHWKHPDFDDSSWKVGQAMLGYGGITGATINTTVEFGGVISRRHTTTHLRKDFTVTGADNFYQLQIDVRRDDAAIVYLNGREIARSNLPDGVINYDTFSETGIFGSAESAPNLFTYDLSPGELLEGENVLAVEVHQQSLGSNDLGIDVQLDGFSYVANDGFQLGESSLVRARTFIDGAWSGLAEEVFYVGNVAAEGNLVISELMYHPVDGGTEFIELRNTSGETIDLSGVHFGAGVDFTIPIGTSLPAGGYYLISAFENNTALANNGETITLLAADGSVIESFRYNDKAPWSTSPDGAGQSLTRVLSARDANDPLSWRPSASPGGSPNTDDIEGFGARDPDSDLDQDGLSGLLEYALGSSDQSADALASLFSINQEGPINLSIQRSLTAGDTALIIEHSTDLETWLPVGNELDYLGSVDHGNGTMTLQFAFSENLDGAHFWRLRTTLP
ncbi:lamin tail domain-containing protein [Akkermansiaceae bacterium]|nr:lamin tail domain-containing protein [Akkermansiaceae bacterium]